MKIERSEMWECEVCSKESELIRIQLSGYASYLCPDCCKQLITALSKELGGNVSEEVEHYKKLVSDANKKVVELKCDCDVWAKLYAEKVDEYFIYRKGIKTMPFWKRVKFLFGRV